MELSEEKERSYNRIDYRLRPAKSIERKMLCDAFRRLLNISDFTDYSYIGFGSPFFCDFTLIHKSLGICDLISIEKEVEDKRRFEFNRPYKCIRLKFGESSEILPVLRLTRKVILWLDYDYRLKGDMLADINSFISRAKSGSIILLTMDVNPHELPKKPKDKSRYEQLLESIGRNKIPPGVTERDLDPQHFPKVCYKVVNNQIDQVLSIRNGVLETKLAYKQLFNFYYKDGSSPMLTVGGIIYSKNDESNISKCSFEKLDFIRTERKKYKPYEIIVPKLTFREMRCLDKVLPIKESTSIKNNREITSIPRELRKQYSKIYRYFPNFVEAEI